MISKNQVKYIQSLSQKKFRDADSVFIAEGPKMVAELLAMPHLEPVGVFGLEAWWESQPQYSKASWAETITQSELERISSLQTPNLVLAIFKKPDLAVEPGSWQLLLDGIRDPGNLGTLIRIADWFGIRQLICSKDCADAFSPKVVQSSMASIGRVEIVYTDLPGYISAHAHRNFYAAVLDGTMLKEVKPHGPSALVIGNESQGIRPDVLQEMHHFITIPRKGDAESLNAAVAAGIILSHLVT
jgi:TrmH family RNA methyltransferase